MGLRRRRRRAISAGPAPRSSPASRPSLVGTALLLASIALVLWVVARRPDRLTLLVGLAVLALAFFVVPTRVHERYGYPFFALGAILAAVSWRWRWAYVALTAATFANMYVVLTTLYPDNPSIDGLARDRWRDPVPEPA